MLKCTSALGTDLQATNDITLMGTIIRTPLTIRTALTTTISHTIATTIVLIIGTVATVTTAIIIIIITTTAKLR